MTFGPEWGWGASKEESRRIFDAYVAAGGNFVDTANRYTEGTSERFVGEFVAADRERFVLATKYTLFSRRDDPSASGNSRKNMVQSLEASLKRLGTDYVDLFWVHAWDFTTPVEEVMRGLDDLVAAGKVLTSASPTRRRGWWRRPTRSQTCAAGCVLWACKFATAWSTGPLSGIYCRWPAALTSR